MTARVVKRDEKKKLAKVPRRCEAEYIEDDIVITTSPGTADCVNNLSMAFNWKGDGDIENNKCRDDLSPDNPKIETNSESNQCSNSKVVFTLNNQDLQEEQFHSNKTTSANNKPTITGVYGNSAGKIKTVRDATMNLYDSLNVSDHI